MILFLQKNKKSGRKMTPKQQYIFLMDGITGDFYFLLTYVYFPAFLQGTCNRIWHGRGRVQGQGSSKKIFLIFKKMLQ